MYKINYTFAYTLYAHIKLLKMDSLLEGLKKYFQSSSKEQIDKDWKETEQWDNVGVSIDDFLNHINFHFKNNFEICKPNSFNQISKFSSKFNSGFFFNQKQQNICNKLVSL